jgi:putative addiction module component (TIGR02574 family)
MKLADLPEVQALSAREKLQLVDELWEDVARDVDSLEVSAEERQVFDERWAAFLHDPSRPLSLQEFKERVRALRA